MSEEKKTVVTSYNQSGGITAHTVNVGSQPRRLSDQLKNQLLSALPKNQKVEVNAIMGDGEAFQYAAQITAFLKSEGYDTDGVNQCVFSAPVLGQNVWLGSPNKVVIGTRQ